ncbi:hypothetical protein K466DRAFT_504721 [Polyporus arcularius HHB13444]|uniref:CxC2-like cysteine cluster KDZ transposase-associated domain-containing protein n=1 Tax=Polyporus arcularius HHB13444 TaxID=1314778 RepID=A0A5C3NQX3_9APHY|nr:hypothetical protein K466DRAFT_504721 [Polyporus arcularius HHB13444]
MVLCSTDSSRSGSYQNKVLAWLPLRAEFLDELIRFYGGEYAVESPDLPCSTCKSVNLNGKFFRCASCTTRSVHCQACLLANHSQLPLHTIEGWNGKHWEKSSLRKLGYVFQLGHDGGPCPCPGDTTRRLVVGDVSGIHEVQIRFCECLDESEEFTYTWVQVFRQGWFPATTNRPATAFTFRMLNAFQELNFQGKTSLYDYWKSLERITDNSGSGPSLVLSHVVRLWRHLTALKRAARAHDPTGPEGTKEGDLAVECPACPHPGKNLPDDWERAPPGVRWLYTLFLMVDANFRAKLKDRGLTDCELGSGWSYYVEQKKFKAHVATIGSQNDTSSCSAEHKAIQNANLRRQSYIASGVGAVLCARHAMVRKTAVGDLPNGEKYLIMDYLVFSTILGVVLMLLISYDIACQWHKKLPRRALHELPAHIRTDISEKEIRYAIPKKHIRVHGPNHSRFSFNFIRWVGRTYAEGIESHWAHMNPVALAAKEMAPGMRREHMDDHWGGWNWQKILGFGLYLLKLLREADRMYAKQRTAHEALTATFSSKNVEKWNKEVEAWHDDPKNAKDPFEEQRATATIKSTRLAIADEEAAELAAGTLPPHDVTPGVFLQVGLEIEEQQRALKARQKNASATDANLADVQEKRTVLQRRIEAWQGMQDLHMPIVSQFRHTGDPSPATSPSSAGSAAGAGEVPSVTKAEHVQLWLPSSLPAPLRLSLSSGLVDKERRLRMAQADDALDDIRRLRRILTGIADFKRYNVSGTGQRTSGRVRTLFAKFDQKVRRAAERYRAARTALECLDRGGDWEARFKVLRDADLRGPGRDGDGEETTRLGEGRYEISWIWLVPRGADLSMPDGVEGELDPNEFLENVKVEWARSQARMERWGEEVLLLQEEMRRVIEYFEWKARWWREQVARRTHIASALQRGLGAYAEFQASVFERLASRFAQLWVPYLRERGKPLPEWSSRYNVPDNPKKRHASAKGAMPSDARAGTSVSTALPEDGSSDSDSEFNSGSKSGSDTE